MFENFIKISVDYGWNDIGSFTALAEVIKPNDNGNIIWDTKIKE